MKLAAFFAAFARKIDSYDDPWLSADPQRPDYFDKPANFRIAELKCGPRKFCDKFMPEKCNRHQYRSLIRSIERAFVRCHGEPLHAPLDCQSANSDWLNGGLKKVHNRMKNVFDVAIREFIFKSEERRCQRSGIQLVSKILQRFVNGTFILRLIAWAGTCF